MNNLYPAIEPYDQQKFPVSSVHTLHVQQVGNPNGRPVLYVHGGPGAGCAAKARRIFNPQYYRLIMIDQRGAGRSTPHGELKDNTTANLINDFEQIREHFDIEQWLLFGGSWGSTLSLLYAQAHPDRITGLILRGIFLGTSRDHAWWFGDSGLRNIYPDAWQRLISNIPESEHHNLLKTIYQRISSDDLDSRRKMADEFTAYELAASKLIVEQGDIDAELGTDFSYGLGSLECHYFANKLFIEEDQILNNMAKIQHLPATIIHGRYDMVCPLKGAWDLHQKWPGSTLNIIPDAGHSWEEPGTTKALVAATDALVQA